MQKHFTLFGLMRFVKFQRVTASVGQREREDKERLTALAWGLSEAPRLSRFGGRTRSGQKVHDISIKSLLGFDRG
jgi:hypothetical protein